VRLSISRAEGEGFMWAGDGSPLEPPKSLDALEPLVVEISRGGSFGIFVRSSFQNLKDKYIVTSQCSGLMGWGCGRQKQSNADLWKKCNTPLIEKTP